MNTAAAARDPAALNSAGVRALAAQDFATAVPLLVAATGADPAAPALWLNLAAAHRGLGDDKAELAALNRALEVDQRNFMAQLRLAELHEKLGDRARAGTHWSAVLALAAQASEALPEALNPVLAHAQEFVSAQNSAFANAVDHGLATVRQSSPPDELRRFDRCVAAATGQSRVFVNHCAGLHYPFLPADEFFSRDHFPWLSKLEAATPIILSEVRALLAGTREGLRPYVEMPSGTPANKWTPLDRSLDWSAFFLMRFGAEQTANLARCPETMRVLEELPLFDAPGRAPTVFFSILKPRTHLPAHTGVSNVRSICHLPLIVPDGCGFRVGGEAREWRVGEAFVFDDTIDHEAWNDSDHPRAVLIFDVWNPHLTETEQQLVREYFRVADASGFDSGLTVSE